MGQLDGGSPPMNMTVAELQAVVAALPAKKDALRGSFDRLAACSPFPLPFTWDDLDAHVSSLHSSISLRLRQLRVLEVAQPASSVPAPATSSDSEKGKNQGEEEEKDEDGEKEMEVEEEEVEVEVEEEEQETEEQVEVVEVEVEEEVVEELEVVDANDEVNDEQKADGEIQEAEEERMEVVADDKEQKADMEGEVIEEQEDADDEMRDADEKQHETKKVCRERWIQEEKGETNKMSPKQGDSTFHCANKDLLTACTRMDYVRLLNIVCTDIGGQQEYTMAMRYAPDGAALVLRVVRGFLSNKQAKTTRVWENCAWLIRCVPVVTPKLSVHLIEQAKQLAMDWKKMIDKPGSCEDLGILASWALLYFLISYKIVSEFDVDEIIRLFGSVPRKHQRKNCIQLCKDLGLVSRITDLIDYLIRNGQQLGVIHMTHVLNLEDKYPLVSLLEGYVEKAKGTALELFGKSASDMSRNLAISREVEDLWLAHIMVKQLTDSSQQSVILAEIKNLLAEYKKNRSLTNDSALLTSNSWQQEKTQQKQQQQKPHGKQQTLKQKKKKRKKDQQQHKAQESQLQGKQRKIQGKQEQQQSKPQEKQQQQQQQQQHKPQQNKGQHQHQPQESKGQQQHEPQEEQQKKQVQNEAHQRQQQHLNRQRPCKTQLPTPLVPAPGLLPLVVPNVAQIGPFGLPPYAVMPEALNYPAQPGLLGIQGGPFAANVGAPQYMGPFNPPQQNHLYRDPLFYPR